MKIDVFNMEKFISLNNLQKVSNPISLNRDFLPTSDGLYSYEIFGKPGSNERKTTFAYIDLNGKYIHPFVYNILINTFKATPDVIAGRKYFKLNEKGHPVEVKEDDKTGMTGIEFFIDNWGKLSFDRDDKEQESLVRDTKLSLLKSLKKDEVFITKWLIIPPAYRDLNFSKLKKRIISSDVVNDIYVKLLSLTTSLPKSSNLYSLFFLTKSTIQTTLFELFRYFQGIKEKGKRVGLLSGKEGIIKSKLMAKTLDYTSRSVLIVTNTSSLNYKTSLVDVDHAAIPISHLCGLFKPFLLKELEDTFLQNPNNQSYDMSMFTTVKLDKIIRNYIKNPSFRSQPVYLDEKRKNIFRISNLEKRINVDYLTWTDVMFYLLYKITKNKHVVINRYPIDSYLNLLIQKINILSTVKTKRVFVPTLNEENPIENWPLIDGNEQFIDTVSVHNSHLKGLGADFDGDTINIRSLFTVEANQEAEKLLNKKLLYIDSLGKSAKPIKNEGILGMYSFTK